MVGVGDNTKKNTDGIALPSQKENIINVTRKMVLKIISVLASGSRIQARHKDSLKVIVKFIRKGICLRGKNLNMIFVRVGPGWSNLC
jgi:hypothetical protein